MRLTRDQSGTCSSQTLWVAGPDHWHGWTGLPDQPCRIAVLQFSSVPSEVADLVGPEAAIALQLQEADCAQLRCLVESLLAERAHRSPLVQLRSEHALLTLSLLVADRYGAPLPVRPQSRRVQLVSTALAWFEEHMEEGPTVDQVARAAGVSPQHLRRLFRQITGMSVKRRLLLAQIARARQLLRRGDDKIGYIARVVGFRSHSAFSRAFRNTQGQPPESYLPKQ